MKNRIYLALALALLLFAGSSRHTARAQFPGMGGTQLYNISSEGCIAAVQADVASQFTAAASSLTGTEATMEAATSTFVAADLATLAAANPHSAVSVRVTRSTSGSSTANGPQGQLTYIVNSMAGFKGC